MQMRQSDYFGRWCRVLVGLIGLWMPVMAKNCDVEPFSMPFENVTVFRYPDVIPGPHKGMQWTFGGSQQLSMGFGTTANSTFVPDSTYLCNSTAPDFKRCIFWRGGVYSAKESPTWTKDKLTGEFNGSVSNAGWDTLHASAYKDRGDDPLTTFTRGWDKVSLADKTLYGYPFSVIENASFPFGTGMFGMATDSVFLKTVVKSKLAPSRSWGFDYGRNGLGEEKNGELVIGGYNSAKASSSDFVTYDVFPDKTKACPFQVQVKSMKMGNVDLMAGQDEFLACIEPAYWSMIMPLKVQSNWNKTLIKEHNNIFWQATWEYFMYNQTKKSTLPKDDIVIELNKGFTVTIPNNEMFFPAVDIDNENGGWVPFEPYTGDSSMLDEPSEPLTHIQSTIGTAGFPPGVEPTLAYLGGPFLSVAYLAVDYESGKFSLAHTKPTASTAPHQFVKLACGDKPPGSSSRMSSKKKAAIIGGVVGGVAGLLLLASLIFFCFFRRKKDPAAPAYTENSAYQGTGTTKQEEEMAQHDAAPRYTSPFSPHGAYAPPPPPESIVSSATFPYSPSFNSAGQTWGTQQLPATLGEGGGAGSQFVEAVEIGDGANHMPSQPQSPPSQKAG